MIDRQPRQISERVLVFLIGAVQFVNILDFVMVMPLGPDFAKSLGIATSQLGYVGGAYTIAAAISGIAGSFFLDRFDRRPALFVAIFGLGLGTLLCAQATDLRTLVAARVLAGAFGGPATSLALAIVADVVPPERRGRAMGAIMGAFAAASVVGVPAGLELARLGSWRTPFLVVGALAGVIALVVRSLLPPLRGHLAARATQPRVSLAMLLSRPTVIASYVMAFAVMLSGFIVIPNISAYVQENRGIPRDAVGRLYFFGGIVSFFSTRAGGWLVDRFGSFRIGAIGTAGFVILNYLWFVRESTAISALMFFVFFMGAMGLRNVAYNTLTSKVPSPSERARFMSILSAVQHSAASTGAFVSAAVLTTDGTRLVGMNLVAWLAIAFSFAIPPLLHLVEKSSTLPRP